MIELLMMLGSFDCSNATAVSALAVMVASQNTYNHSHDCTDFSYELATVMKQLGCNVRMDTGWYGVKGQQRYWHRWVETPDFMVEATPDSVGVISNTKLYDRRYFTSWGWVHMFG